MFQAQKKLKRYLVSLPLVFSAGFAHAETLDLLVAYDSTFRNAERGQPQVKIRNHVNEINTYYENSGMDVQLRLVGTMLNDDIAGPTDGARLSYISGIRIDGLPVPPSSHAVRRKREEVGADFVVQFTTMERGYCGIGFTSARPASAYSIVGYDCGAITVAHEIGHNMGLNHSHRQGPDEGYDGGTLYPYGLGHGVDNLFVTVMAYPRYFSTRNQIGKFSNPRIRCVDTVPCGVPEGRPLQADAVKAVNNVKDKLAAFRPTVGGGGSDNDVVENGLYRLKLKDSNMCANVATRADDSLVQQRPCENTGKDQRFYLTQKAGGFYQIKSTFSIKCLDVAPNSSLSQSNCNSKADQHWNLVRNGDGSFRLKARQHGGVATVKRVGQDGGWVLADPWSGTQGQSWRLERW